jgi:hypothetical protein
MSTTSKRLTWDQTGERLFETGVKQGVVYPQGTDGSYPKGVAWNGLTAVTESPSGAEATALYADDIKYLNLLSTEEFGATIEAYTYPEEFEACDGSASLAVGVTVGQQKRKAFGLSYKTTLGNDVDSYDYGYKLHLIYGALAAPSEKAYATINDSPEAITFSWEVTTTPVNVAGLKPTASVTINSKKVDAEKLAKLEAILYGTDPELLTQQPSDWTDNYTNYFTKSGNEYVAVTASGSAPEWEASKYYTAGTEARLPLPDEIASIFAEG